MSEGADGVLTLRSHMGLVMQNPDDQMVASIVVDEVAFGPSNLGLPKEEVVARVQHALDSVGMTSLHGLRRETFAYRGASASASPWPTHWPCGRLC